MIIAKKILVVDDEQDIVEILIYNLSKQKLEVRGAYSGTECIRIAKQFHPDLIVMDVRMPETNGIEACRMLKLDEELKNIPVLFLTADTDQNTLISAITAGGNRCVNKPIPISELTELIMKMVA